ncbi:MAG: hypothetical protein AB7G28_17705 [Pirellulales bacterium]
MRHVSCALAVVVLSLGITAGSYAADEFTGYIVKLAEKTSTTEPQSANVGGLVIVVVRDSGSRPPKDISVVPSDGLAPLGKLRGVQNDEGVALMGGGYTWYLFKPTTAGDATVKVTFTPNGVGAKPIERTYKLKIES